MKCEGCKDRWLGLKLGKVQYHEKLLWNGELLVMRCKSK